MIDDPKRPIENELEAWAKARREDAGPPFELHPVSRRLLHEEVAQVHPLPAQPELQTEPEPAGSLWARSWRSLAVGLTVVFAFVMVVLVYRPSEPTNEFLMTKSEALEDLERRGLAAPAKTDELTLKAQQVMQAAEEQTLASRQAPAGFFDQASGQSVQLVGTDSGTMKLSSGAVGDAVVTLTPAEPLAAQAPATFKGTVSMEPAAAAKVAVLTETSTVTNGIVAGSVRSASLSAAEVSAREAELNLVAKALRQSNEEINLELTRMRLQEGVDAAAAPAPVVATASPAVSPKDQELGEKLTYTDTRLGRAAVPMSFRSGTGPAPAAPVANRTLAKAKASAPAEPKPAAPTSSSTLSIRQEFSQAMTRSTLRRNFNSPPTAPVLQNFTVENTGSAVRIVDEDGSVYTGALEIDPTASSELNRFPFSAVGLNRTLDVQVRFKGALEALSDGRLQVRGRASVGIRTELEIDARPATAP